MHALTSSANPLGRVRRARPAERVRRAHPSRNLTARSAPEHVKAWSHRPAIGIGFAGLLAVLMLMLAGGGAAGATARVATAHRAPSGAASATARAASALRTRSGAARPERHRKVGSAHQAAASAPASAVSSSVAGDQGGCSVVHIGPYVTPGEAASSYFNLNLARGSVTSEGLVVANPEAEPCQVTLLPAYGATAVNGGDSYVPISGAANCVGASCWLGGLPTTVTVPPKSRQVFSFPIDVPARAASGQYLAGIIGEPATPPRPAALRSAAEQGVVSASIVTRVAIGVAVTVPGALLPKLSVPAVVLSSTSSPPSLQVTVANSGNTWIHPAGHVKVTLGAAQQDAAPRSTTVELRAATVLPGGQADLDVPVGQLPPGPHVVTVEIPYAKTKDGVARWTGTIEFPAASALAPARPGTTTRIVTQATVPTWVIALVVGLAVALLVLATVTLRIMMRRSRGPAREGGPRNKDAVEQLIGSWDESANGQGASSAVGSHTT